MNMQIPLATPVLFASLITLTGCTYTSSDRDCFSVPQSTHLSNKPGFIKSPYAPHAGYIDARGVPTGTTIKCPYTGKPFQTE